MVRQRNRRIHFHSGFSGSFDAPWPEISWINLSSKETQNPFSDSFGFKNPVLDFLKETHPKVIRLKLFLDIVLSFFEDITRAMRAQPKRLSRTTLHEKNCRERHFTCFGFVYFVSYRRCFLHSQPPFCAVGHFVCFSACLAVHFVVYSVLGS